MKYLFKIIILFLLPVVLFSCSKSDDTPDNVDMSQYRLVYTYRARTWQAQKDHIGATYVDFATATQAESFGKTFPYTFTGNKVTFTNSAGDMYSFSVDPKTMAVSNFTTDNTSELEYQIVKLQKKDGSQSLLNNKYSGMYSFNQDDENILMAVNFKFSAEAFVKYGLVIGAEPQPSHPATFRAQNTAFYAEISSEGEYYSGILIDGKLYVNWTVYTSPYAYWGTLKLSN